MRSAVVCLAAMAAASMGEQAVPVRLTAMALRQGVTSLTCRTEGACRFATDSTWKLSRATIQRLFTPCQFSSISLARPGKISPTRSRWVRLNIESIFDGSTFTSVARSERLHADPDCRFN